MITTDVDISFVMQYTATHCSTLQYTATHCNTLQHTATHSNTLQHTANPLQYTAAHSARCTTLHHTSPHSNTLQHTLRQQNTFYKASSAVVVPRKLLFQLKEQCWRYHNSIFNFFLKIRKCKFKLASLAILKIAFPAQWKLLETQFLKFAVDVIACPAPKKLQIENCISSFSLLENCFTRAKSGRHSTKPAWLWEYKGNWVPALLLIRHKHRKLSSEMIFWIFCLRSRANSCQRFRFGTNVAGRPCECGFGGFGV